MAALPQFEERGGLGEIVEGRGAGALGGGLGGGREAVLEGLGFERADDVEADGGGEGAAQMMEGEQAKGGLGVHFETAQGGAEDGREMAMLSGTPQGGVISPLLSNIYLAYLDERWTKQCSHLGVLVRYCDDFVVICKTAKDGDEAERRVRIILARLKLELHPEKTRRVELSWGKQGFDFLGCYLRKRLSGRIWEKARKRIPLYGEISSGTAVPAGCRFHPRCYRARLVAAAGRTPTAAFGNESLPAICMGAEPALAPASKGHLAACHFNSTDESST